MKKVTAETRFDDIVGNLHDFEYRSAMLGSPPMMMMENSPSLESLEAQKEHYNTFDFRKNEIDRLTQIKSQTLERVNTENTLKINVL